jgi:DNA-binding transcriptional regulator LsrR (DeoR family)
MQSGKTRAEIARSMGTTYQTIDGLLEAAAKKKLLPIELIPLLPARFAKYTGV